MKKIFTILSIIAIAQNSYSQTGVSYSTPVPVVASTQYGNYWPRVVLDGSSNPIVIWGNQAPPVLYSSRMSSGSFVTPIQVNPVGIDPFIQLWSGPEIAAVGDSIFITYKTDPVVEGKVYIQRSIDGGISYNDTIRVENIGSDISRFPSVQIDFGGNPVVNFMRFDSVFGSPRYVVAHSYDAGLTFNPDVNATANVQGQVCECCPAVMNIKGNREIIMFRNNNNNIRTIWTSISYDDGQTFPANGEVDQTNWQVLSCPSDMPSGIVNGDTLTCVWRSSVSGQSKVYLGNMSLLTYQVGYNTPIFDFVTGSSQDSPFIVGNGDTVGVVWQQTISGSAKILFSYSVTGPSGLGIHIDTISASIPGIQFTPHMLFSNGVFHIVYTNFNTGEVMYQTATLFNATGIQQMQADAISALQVLNQQQGDPIVQFVSDIPQQALLTIYSATGKKIAEQKAHVIKGANQIELDTKHLSTGIFFVQLTTSDNSYKTKFIVK